MPVHNDFESVMAVHPALEAVIRMSRDGLPLSSRVCGGAPIDEIVSIVAGLFAAASETGLIDGKNGGRLHIDARHGSLYCRAEDAQTLLLFLTKDHHTEQQFEVMFETVRKHYRP